VTELSNEQLAPQAAPGTDRAAPQRTAPATHCSRELQPQTLVTGFQQCAVTAGSGSARNCLRSTSEDHSCNISHTEAVGQIAQRHRRKHSSSNF
jgi:hypothetical protein